MSTYAPLSGSRKKSACVCFYACFPVVVFFFSFCSHFLATMVSENEWRHAHTHVHLTHRVDEKTKKEKFDLFISFATPGPSPPCPLSPKNKKINNHNVTTFYVHA